MSDNKRLKIIKGVIVGALVAMVLIDLVLVFSDDHPTFSRIFREHRTELIWVNFLYGGLMAKIFWFRIANRPRWEFAGFLTFLTVVVGLFFAGRLLTVHVDTPYQLLILLTGGGFAYLVWPQYVPPQKQAEVKQQMGDIS